MYGKAFESQYEGSMYGAGINVFAVWNYVIAKAHYGTIELNPKLVAAVLGGTVEEVVEAIEFLCAPDPESRSKLEEGRRMVKEGQFQYRVVNWENYQLLKTQEARREYNRVKQAEHRAKKKREGTSRGKSRAQVRAEAQAREKRFEAAVANGQEAAADRIAAEGLPSADGDTTHKLVVGPPMDGSDKPTLVEPEQIVDGGHEYDEP